MEHARIEQFLLPNGNQDLITKAVLESVQEGKLSREVRSLICSLQRCLSQRSFSNVERCQGSIEAFLLKNILQPM